MKIHIISIFLLLLTNLLFSQEKKTAEIKIFSNDNLIIDVNYDSWLNTPSNVTLKPYSRGINISYLETLLGQHSNISLAAGFGISCQNYFIDATPEIDNQGVTSFVNIPDNIDYKTNKLATTYIELPVEIRLRTNKASRKDKSFKIFAGFKAGYLVNNHTKYNGDNIDGSGKEIKIKQYNIDNIQKYHYGVSARIGYGKFNITGFYSLTQMFEKDKGPDITPFSVGLSISPF